MEGEMKDCSAGANNGEGEMNGGMNEVVEVSAKTEVSRADEPYVGAMLLARECGLVQSVQRWMEERKVLTARVEGTSRDRAAIEDTDAWLEWAQAEEAARGEWCLVDTKHPHVQTLVKHVRGLRAKIEGAAMAQ